MNTKQSKSFLILCSFLIINLVGCAILFPRKIISEDFPGTFFGMSSSLLFGPRPQVSLTGKMEQKYSEQTTQNDIDLKLQHALCNGGKQISPIKVNYQYIMPAIKQGLPLDAANTLRETWLTAGRNFAKEFFVTVATPSEIKPQNYIKDLEKIFPDGDVNHISGQQGAFVSVPISTRADFTKHFKDFRTSQSTFMNNPVVLGYNGNAQKNDPNALNYFVVSRTPANYSIFSYGAVVTQQYGTRTLGFRWKKWAVDDYNSNTYLMHPFYTVSSSIEVTPTTEPDDPIVFPMAASSMVEPTFLRRDFVMLIPKEVQDTLFSGSSDIRSHVYFGYSGESIVPSVALQQSELMWNTYFRSMTTAQDSPTDDPQIIKFNVELNLEPFCKYGRLKTDLVSK